MTAGQPLRGLVGQSMSGRRPSGVRFVAQYELAAGSGSIVVPQTGFALCYLVGGGGSGAGNSGSGLNNSGGGGGGATYGELRVGAGQLLQWTVGAGGAAPIGNPGNIGGDTFLAIAGSIRLRATGGLGGLQGAGTMLGVAGGVGSGGLVNRRGGASGGSAGLVGTTGEAGEYGGSGGAGVSAASGLGGGGGAAGFSDLVTAGLFVSGAGSAAINTDGIPGLNYGGGSGACTPTTTTGVGGPGRMFILFIQNFAA